jgi:hypothetical protein
MIILSILLLILLLFRWELVGDEQSKKNSTL